MLYVFDKVLSIHLWCFYFILGVFFYLFTSKSNVNYAYFYVLFYLFFVTTLKYHSNKFLQLKPKDEVTAVTCCLILAYFRML